MKLVKIEGGFKYDWKVRTVVVLGLGENSQSIGVGGGKVGTDGEVAEFSAEVAPPKVARVWSASSVFIHISLSRSK